MKKTHVKITNTPTKIMMIWQTTDWGKMLLVSKQADRVFSIGGIQIEKRCVGLGFYGLFIIGLDYKQSGIDDNLQALEDQIVALCKKEKALFIQIEFINYSGNLETKYFDLDTLDFGFYKKFINQYTAVIDLHKTEEEILAGMKPKGRYNIKLAVKKGIVVKEVEKTKENIEKYYNLMLETTSRDNFSGNTLKYYSDFLKYIKESKLLLAYSGETVVAGGIFTFRKELAIYYYGASTSQKEFRNLMAPYLVQWEAIKIAKKSGSQIYDFLGVATPGDDNHPLKGVTDFKKKFTKDIRKVSESYIFIQKPFVYKVLRILAKLKKIFKNIKHTITSKIKKSSI
ncbi:peptidoglycan bridge formation glycyltransferase FemA/FemB family protein [Candidatus Gracilibacteria bacterium]|nr:peptidoglycan bridge formation glycyltransferase FemA/FemB family protein [Candidatus Gracilibacteria bacterium]